MSAQKTVIGCVAAIYLDAQYFSTSVLQYSVNVLDTLVHIIESLSLNPLERLLEYIYSNTRSSVYIHNYTATDPSLGMCYNYKRGCMMQNHPVFT